MNYTREYLSKQLEINESQFILVVKDDSLKDHDVVKDDQLVFDKTEVADVGDIVLVKEKKQYVIKQKSADDEVIATAVKVQKRLR